MLPNWWKECENKICVFLIKQVVMRRNHWWNIVAYLRTSIYLQSFIFIQLDISTTPNFVHTSVVSCCYNKYKIEEQHKILPCKSHLFVAHYVCIILLLLLVKTFEYITCGLRLFMTLIFISVNIFKWHTI